MRSLASRVQILAAIAGGLGAVYLAWASSTPIAQTMAITIIGLSSISGFAVFANRWTQAALVDRLDILLRAVDTTADAQILAAPNGQVTYANDAFQHMFPGGETPLERIERSLAADVESTMEFRRLSSRGGAGIHATADLSLRDARSGAVGRFHVLATPIAGWPGYSFWSIRDITTRHERETMLRAERDALEHCFSFVT
jgi:PAS domain-containing protein